jgi:hypothetical protein
MPYCLRDVVFFSFFVLQRHCRWILEGIIHCRRILEGIINCRWILEGIIKRKLIRGEYWIIMFPAKNKGNRAGWKIRSVSRLIETFDFFILPVIIGPSRTLQRAFGRVLAWKVDMWEFWLNHEISPMHWNSDNTSIFKTNLPSLTSVPLLLSFSNYFAFIFLKSFWNSQNLAKMKYICKKSSFISHQIKKHFKMLLFRCRHAVVIMQTLNLTNQCTYPLFITVRHIFEISEDDHPPKLRWWPTPATIDEL